MPKKHNAGGCGCCGGCPSAGCNIFGSTLTVGISGSPDSATVIEFNPSTGVVTNTYTLSPPTGSHSITYVTGRVYLIRLVGPDACYFEQGCGDPQCFCDELKRFARITVVHNRGITTGTDYTGTYIVPLTANGLGGCNFILSLVTAANDSLAIESDPGLSGQFRLTWLYPPPPGFDGVASAFGGLVSCDVTNHVFNEASFPEIGLGVEFDVTIELF